VFGNVAKTLFAKKNFKKICLNFVLDRFDVLIPKMNLKKTLF